MLTYQEALRKILEHSFSLKIHSLPLREGLGQVAGKDLFAPGPFPSFDNSAVDGYAVSGEFARKSGENFKLEIQGEVPAGESFQGVLKPGHAVRVFTGAPVPRGTYAVVMQEDVERMNGSVRLRRGPNAGDHIRFCGEDFHRGRVLIRKGQSLTPAHLALLAAVGYEKVPVYPSPQVTILSTGSELLKKREKPKLGKIHDSNTILLEALVKEGGGLPILSPTAKDDPGEIRSRVQQGFKSDLLILSGGVSVGKYDFVKEVLKKEGVKEIFWKVAIKPGKPLFFGKKGRTLVFGLPGNPVSAFVTFEEFVKPYLLKMRGSSFPEESMIQGRLTKPFQNGSRFHFVRVRCVPKRKGYAVTPLEGQGSHMIGSLALADGLLRVEPNVKLKRNQRVLAKRIRER